MGDPGCGAVGLGHEHVPSGQQGIYRHIEGGVDLHQMEQGLNRVAQVVALPAQIDVFSAQAVNQPVSGFLDGARPGDQSLSLDRIQGRSVMPFAHDQGESAFAAMVQVYGLEGAQGVIDASFGARFFPSLENGHIRRKPVEEVPGVMAGGRHVACQVHLRQVGKVAREVNIVEACDPFAEFSFHGQLQVRHLIHVKTE